MSHDTARVWQSSPSPAPSPHTPHPPYTRRKGTRVGPASFSCAATAHAHWSTRAGQHTDGIRLTRPLACRPPRTHSSTHAHAQHWLHSPRTLARNVLFHARPLSLSVTQKGEPPPYPHCHHASGGPFGSKGGWGVGGRGGGVVTGWTDGGEQCCWGEQSPLPGQTVETQVLGGARRGEGGRSNLLGKTVEGEDAVGKRREGLVDRDPLPAPSKARVSVCVRGLGMIESAGG